MTAELLWRMVAADPTIGDSKEMPMFRKASGKVSEMHMKAKGRWSGDIAYIYARVCPDMDRKAVRAMCCTDASPFMESIDSHWATVAACTEDAADLGDAKELDDDGDEALSDDEDQAEDDNDL